MEQRLIVVSHLLAFIPRSESGRDQEGVIRVVEADKQQAPGFLCCGGEWSEQLVDI